MGRMVKFSRSQLGFRGVKGKSRCMCSVSPLVPNPFHEGSLRTWGPKEIVPCSSPDLNDKGCFYFVYLFKILHFAQLPYNMQQKEGFLFLCFFGVSTFHFPLKLLHLCRLGSGIPLPKARTERWSINAFRDLQGALTVFLIPQSTCGPIGECGRV
jgi:hypothetical protein